MRRRAKKKESKCISSCCQTACSLILPTRRSCLLYTSLIYWADQGNLEIHQEDKKNVSFKKVKDLPDTANDYERILFDKMFSGRESISVKDMQYTFSDTIAAVKSRIKDKYEMEQNRVFTKKSLRRQSFAGAFAAFPMALMLAFSIYLDSYELFAAIIPLSLIHI